ncbi:16S rRNA (cytosine(1402)-N(4))-methyltransferase, partial [Candidatus Saccharibacteria bacterium 32-49-10]
VAEGKRYDMILVDLGVSSPQLDRAERGFSLKREGPLDMRMDQTMEKTAAEIVNRSSETNLISILERFGEETPSDARRIAKAIVDARPITTTTRLAEVVLSTHRGAYKKTHPATRTFQAIRIALNGELEQLEQTLRRIPHLLEPNGRIAIISFHSLEDRLVKEFFREQDEAGYESQMQTVTKKAIQGKLYDVHNPRSRSALLRVAVKK